MLRQIHVPFVIVPVEIEEVSPGPGADPSAIVRENALRKARAIVDPQPDSLIVAADTVVVQDGCCLGKPRDAEQARSMLQTLSGTRHVVLTALCLRRGVEVRVDTAATEVAMARLTEATIEAYVATGEPSDKAGGYGIQRRGAVLIDSISGDYSNVVGLPLRLLGRMLEEFGVSISDYW